MLLDLLLMCLCVCGGGNKENIYSLDLSKLCLSHFCEGLPLVENTPGNVTACQLGSKCSM